MKSGVPFCVEGIFHEVGPHIIYLCNLHYKIHIKLFSMEYDPMIKRLPKFFSYNFNPTQFLRRSNESKGDLRASLDRMSFIGQPIVPFPMEDLWIIEQGHPILIECILIHPIF